MKLCKLCVPPTLKPNSAFYKQKNGYLQSGCKTCRNQRTKLNRIKYERVCGKCGSEKVTRK